MNDSSTAVVNDEIGLSLKLPPKWEPVPMTFTADDKKSYFYRRDAVLDSSGYLAKGLMEISVQDLPDSIDFGLFSVMNRRDKRINVLEYFTPLDSMTSLSPSIVYLAEYTDDINKKKYKSYFIDTKYNGKGIRIVIGSNTGAFDMLKGEYYFILKSLKFK